MTGRAGPPEGGKHELGTMAPAAVIRRRRERLRKRFRSLRVGGLLVSNMHNVRYLSGFTGEDSALLMSGEGDVLVTDSRFTEQAGEEAQGVAVVTRRRRSLMAAVASRARQAEIARLGFEARALTVRAHGELGDRARRMELVPTTGEVEQLRQIKDRYEVAAIEQAVRAAEGAFQDVRHLIRPRVTEIDLARALEVAMLQRGAEAPAFPTIVAFAERASLPHARPTKRRLRSGEAVLVDWGARVDFYNSDLTRVLFLDKIPRLLEHIYRVTLAAQGTALRRIGTGISSQQADAVARRYIARKGYGRHFRHNLGHGIGLEVHEDPGLRRGGERTLQPGMVVTVEPGIYVPRRGGVRIEDMVLIRRSGPRVLTQAPRSLRSALIQG